MSTIEKALAKQKAVQAETPVADNSVTTSAADNSAPTPESPAASAPLTDVHQEKRAIFIDNDKLTERGFYTVVVTLIINKKSSVTSSENCSITLLAPRQKRCAKVT